jgi:hypothetical protein
VAALLILLAQSLYALPGELPAPSEAEAKRIERALRDLRGEERERGVRELALLGRSALRAVVARLNQANSAERILLLTAVGRLPESTTLIQQARKDPAPEVRALADPPGREPRSLAQLAARYIDLLALTRNAKREDVTRPLYELKPRIARPKDQYDAMRAYLGDEEMDRAVQGEYDSSRAPVRQLCGAARSSPTSPIRFSSPTSVCCTTRRWRRRRRSKAWSPPVRPSRRR